MSDSQHQTIEMHDLPGELPPPVGLYGRVLDAARAEGLVMPRRARWHANWPLAAAAGITCLALGLGTGWWLGKAEEAVPGGSLTALTGAETNLFALLLYETPGYQVPRGAESLIRYGEYARWVTHAISRDQFVTGEDLQVDAGWRLLPGGEAHRASTPTPESAPALTAIFFVRAHSEEEALELARSLPHLKHGGEVVVQKTIPTDSPPEPD